MGSGSPLGDKSHWENVYGKKSIKEVSWHQEHLQISLQLILSSCPDRNASIIDVGGGASTLVDDLMRMGYQKLSVLDISEIALDKSKERLGGSADRVRWICADITSTPLESDCYDLWHDRAVFHFLTDPTARATYIATATRSIKEEGFLIVATFALDGPEQCSGLPVVRYGPEQLTALFDRFVPVESKTERHVTPAGSTQSFTYLLLQKRPTTMS